MSFSRVKRKRNYFILVLSCVLFICFSCRSNPKEKVYGPTSIEWNETTYDFGTITKGETVVHTFKFKNGGPEPLKIKKIETGCGCTTVDYPQKEVYPGEEGKIEVAFNSEGKYGKQYKEICIFANIPDREQTLKIVVSIK